MSISGQSYSQRAKAISNQIAKKLLLLMDDKGTNLCLANDETNPEKMLDNADRVGADIALLKTHIDVVENFTPKIITQLQSLAKQHGFLIFEDRKFADIGNTVKLQYAKGIYNIASWADITNAHVVPGPGIIEGLREVANTIDEPRGLILLAQMSSKGNLATAGYTSEAIKMAKEYQDFVIGFIGNGGNVNELKKLSGEAGDDFLILTPGVKLGGGGDKLGQKYTTPSDVITAGADVIIVGRGIYSRDNIKQAAQQYRTAGWEAYKKRIST
ncbi:orotidine-5'-phosphate decarboxylase [Patescibacteria group bacterium]|nr:orotidine-5'-phosphate decarboxylase [Patescibacteria group bacterium]